MSNTRCKAGDLAIIIHSKAGNEGKIVTCLKYLGRVRTFSGDDYWEIDQELTDTWGLKGSRCRDSDMRPFGKPDGEDETFQWAGKPNVALLD